MQRKSAPASRLPGARASWTAPAKRSGDGAVERLEGDRGAPKRCRASLATAVQNALVVRRFTGKSRAALPSPIRAGGTRLRYSASRRQARALRHSNRAEDCFTLLEVMIATALFFMVAFSVLALVSQSLQQAHALKGIRTPLSSLAAQASITNKLEEGFDSGDFGDIFPGYEWSKETTLFQSNDLYEVHLTVSRKGVPDSESEMTILLFDKGGAVPGRRGPIRRTPRNLRR